MKRCAIIFDFDDTLCPDSTNAYLKACGVDTQAFWKKCEASIEEGFDPVLAYMHGMVKEARVDTQHSFYTRESFKQFAKTLPLHPGVEQLLPDLQSVVSRSYPELELSCYLVSSGLAGILNECPIATHFDGIFASEFIYDSETGIIDFPKRAVSFTDKTRFLFSISKGVPLSREFIPDPFQVNQKMSMDDYAVPFKRILYAGDGYTDVPAFALLKSYGGLSLAIRRTDKPHTAQNLVQEDRVLRAVPGDFTVGGAVAKELCLFLEHCRKY